jgi:hypothetical protein
MPSRLSEWSSPDGKLDWGFSGEEVNKLRTSASFGFRSGGNAAASPTMAPPNVDEPDVSWVNSLVKDVPAGGASEQRPGGVYDTMSYWLDQMHIEQEKILA